MLAGALVLIRAPAPFVERWYSDGLYPRIAHVVYALVDPLPFCLGDVLAVVLAALAALALGRAVRAPGARLRILRRAIAAVAIVAIWFEVSWGLGYGRVPLGDKLVVDDARTNERSVDAFADHVVAELSAAAGPAHRADDAGELGARLAPTFAATIARLGDRGRFPPQRIKPTIFQSFMERSATSGFTDPWTHEINVDASATRYERPAYYAHEWAHASGFNDEAEANYIAVIACRTSRDPVLAYSGWLLTFFNLPGNVRLSRPMGRLAYDDVMAIRRRVLHQLDRHVVAAQHVAYDAYLHSNGVTAGYASYGLFVRWLVGGSFDRSGLPRVRAASDG